MNFKPYLSLLLIVFSFIGCKKDIVLAPLQTPKSHPEEHELIDISIPAKTGYRLLKMADNTDTINFYYNESGNVKEIVKSFWIQPRGVAPPYIVRLYTLIKYDANNRPSWFIKDVLNNNVENLNGSNIIYNDEAQRVEIQSKTTTYRYVFVYTKSRLSLAEKHYEEDNLYLNYTYEGNNLSGIAGNRYDSTELPSYSRSFKKFDDKKTFVAAIPGINNMLAAYLFDWTDIFNNCQEYSQDNTWQDTAGIIHTFHTDGTYNYTYNSEGLPLTRKSVINGKDDDNIVFIYSN